MGNRKHKAYLKSQYKKRLTKNDNELQGCREQCTVADLRTEVLITLL